ncbi:Ribosomal protein L29/L35, partial [Dillenia turbinata]
MLSLLVSISTSSPNFILPLNKSLSPTKKSSFNGITIHHVCLKLTPLSSATPKSLSSSSPVMMAKREEELKEIRAKSTEELNEEIVDLKGELLMLRLQKSARNEFKSNKFRRMCKKREIEKGIDKRLSRKLDRQWKKSIIVRPPPSLKKLQEEEAAEEAEKSKL